MAKRIVRAEQAKADVRGIERSLQILKTLARRAQTGEGNYLEISLGLDRKEAYR